MPKKPESSLPKYPYIFLRRYLCGHSNEFIEVSRPPGSDSLTHTLVSFERYEEGKKGKNGLKYTLERCIRCAEEHRIQRFQKRPSESIRSLKAHQGETLGQASNWRKDGFDHVLNRLAYKDDRVEHTRVLHERVPEYEHQMLDHVVVGPNGRMYERAKRVIDTPKPQSDSIMLQREFSEDQVEPLRRSDSTIDPRQVRRGDILPWEDMEEPRHFIDRQRLENSRNLQEVILRPRADRNKIPQSSVKMRKRSHSNREPRPSLRGLVGGATRSLGNTLRHSEGPIDNERGS